MINTWKDLVSASM